ncbi:MAG: preprotein translocase subunit SecE [Patescibacteria group bacterium]|nr:preprotein translocase subunit SecE [Patescibacteria group bacterium]MDE2438073.1 preprotein translocase subunit SecE [Patescibacteria group bacterium]
MTKLFGNIIPYTKEVYFELKKVNWLSQKQLIQYTIAVIGLSLFVALFLGLLDAGFVYAITNYFVK